jgi:hypothetical protein
MPTSVVPNCVICPMMNWRIPAPSDDSSTTAATPTVIASAESP